MFNLTGAMTGQSIQLLGMMTEAVHNPFLMDRYIALKNANYIFKGASALSREIQYQPNGKIVRRARHVMENAWKLLKRVQGMTLMNAIEQGLFANMARPKEGGKGLDGVFQRDRGYFNPFSPSRGDRPPPEESRRQSRGGVRGEARPEGRSEGRREGQREGQGEGRGEARPRGDRRRHRGGRGRRRGERGPRSEGEGRPPTSEGGNTGPEES